MKVKLEHSLLRLVIIFVASSSCCCARNPKEHEESKDVTVLGLGDMGKAIVQCYSKHGYTVHAWNRSEKKRQIVQDLDLPGVHVYDDLTVALQQSKSNIVLMNIDAGSHLSIPQSLLKPNSQTSTTTTTTTTTTTNTELLWRNKTLVQFSSHTPTDAWAHHELLTSLQGSLVAGALVAIPETICSDAATILVSSNNEDDNDMKNGALHKTQSTLEHLGNLVQFAENVGLASLANMAIIQALTFGVAGHEMGHLIMEQYGVSDDFRSKYLELVTSIITSYVPMLYNIISQSISTKMYQTYSYVPSSDFLRLLEMHQQFIVEDMGIASNTYLAGYIHYVRKVSDPLGSPSAWVDTAVVSADDNSADHDAWSDEMTEQAQDSKESVVSEL